MQELTDQEMRELISEFFNEDDPDFEKLVKPVPVVGEVVYSHLLGGAEEYNRDKLLGRK